MPSARIPFPSATFVGRATEIARLEEGLSRVPVALIYGGAGIGKSALAYAFAALTKGPVVYHKVTADEPLAAVLDDVRRQLSTEAVPELPDDFSRLKDLARRLESPPALWVLDDINRLAPEAQEALLVTLGANLRQGRLIATSRELLRRFENAPDWVELRLGGLDDENSRVLWYSLDELYGPSAGFETAWQRSRGSPLMLRRAHAGEVDEEDPLAAQARALTPDERVVAGALAVAGMRLPSELLMGLAPGPRVRGAIRQLSTRMLLEVDGAGKVAISDLYRDAVLDELSPDERKTLHAELARLLPGGAGIDPSVRVREVCRHLCALGRHEEAGAYLLEHGVELI
ncbi:MAG TPA: ATP-binding protein, partial [Longimicrobium sp.]|nr:ATP-binding protein [Longimicrobium sp.]